MAHINKNSTEGFTTEPNDMVLEGEEALKHFQEVLDNHIKTGKYISRDNRLVRGGWWAEQGFYVAFDAEADYTVEEFSSEKEAQKYANGKLSITRGGGRI